MSSAFPDAPATTPTDTPAPNVRVEDAARPSDISARGWREIVWAALVCALKHRAPSQAAAATFYGFLAFVPAVAAFGAAYGLVANLNLLEHRLSAFAALAPAGVLRLVQRQVLQIARGPPLHLLGGFLGFGAVALGSATSAMRQIMIGLATAYRLTDTRPWWMRRLVSFGFAVGVCVLGGLTVGLVLKSSDMDDVGFWAVVRLVLRWTALFLAALAGLTLLYRYGPARPRARWRWVTPGSAVAALTLLLTSAGVTLYLARVSSYERTYGGLGSVLGLVVWMWAAMLVVILGAELNRAIEDKTSADTGITGRPEPPPGAPAAAPPPGATAAGSEPPPRRRAPA